MISIKSILYTSFLFVIISIFTYITYQSNKIDKLEKDNIVKTIENETVKENLTIQKEVVKNYKQTSQKLNNEIKEIENKEKNTNIEFKDAKELNKIIACRINKIKDYEKNCN